MARNGKCYVLNALLFYKSINSRNRKQRRGSIMSISTIGNPTICSRAHKNGKHFWILEVVATLIYLPRPLGIFNHRERRKCILAKECWNRPRGMMYAQSLKISSTLSWPPHQPFYFQELQVEILFRPERGNSGMCGGRSVFAVLISGVVLSFALGL